MLLHDIPKEKSISFSLDEKRAILAWNAEMTQRLQYTSGKLQYNYSGGWLDLNIRDWSMEYDFTANHTNDLFPNFVPIEEFEFGMVDYVTA